MVCWINPTVNPLDRSNIESSLWIFGRGMLSTFVRYIIVTVFAATTLSNYTFADSNTKTLQEFPANQFGQVVLHKTDTIRQFLKRSEFISLHTYPPLGGLRKLTLPIGRLEALRNSKVMHVCTAFLISNQHILTNEHCVRGKPKGMLFRYDYTFVGEGAEARAMVIDPVPLEQNQKLDYAILKRGFGDLPTSIGSKYVRLSTAELGLGEAVLLVGHPDGMPKMVSQPKSCNVRDAIPRKLNRIDNPVYGIELGCSSLGGSSGSPIFQIRTTQVAAILHSNTMTGKKSSKSFATSIRSIAAVSPILRRIIATQEAESKGCFLFNNTEYCGGSTADPIRPPPGTRRLIIHAPHRTRGCIGNRCKVSEVVTDGSYELVFRPDGSIFWVGANSTFPTSSSSIDLSKTGGIGRASIRFNPTQLKLIITISKRSLRIRTGVILRFGPDGRCRVEKIVANKKAQKIRFSTIPLKPLYCVWL